MRYESFSISSCKLTGMSGEETVEHKTVDEFSHDIQDVYVKVAQQSGKVISHQMVSLSVYFDIEHDEEAVRRGIPTRTGVGKEEPQDHAIIVAEFPESEEEKVIFQAPQRTWA